MRKGEVSSLTLEQLEPLQTLGSGACGTVRLARHRASGKTIALKIINITDQGQRHQVLNELHVLCALNDEHIVPLHDAFYLDGNVYLALGYCNGGSLDDLLAFLAANGFNALRLLFNLSVDPAIREQMVKAGAIPKFVEMLKHPRFRGVTLRLLYHMSIDDRCKSLFTYTEAIPITMQLVIKFPQDRIARELGALAVNLSLNARNAELMCGNKGLYHLVARVERE